MATATHDMRTYQTDPLRILPLKTVCERTGYSRRSILRMLAEDAKEKAPGRRFPHPLRVRGDSNRLEWRELDLLNWLETRSKALIAK